jgi:hypothetical protein
MTAHVRGVELPEGRSGSSFLHELLQHAVTQFPAEFSAVRLPSDARKFKDVYGDVLVHFEAARAVSERRVEIALSMRRLAASRLRFVDDAGARSFAEAMATPAAPIALQAVSTRGPGRLAPGVTVGGVRQAGDALRAWLVQANAERIMTDAARVRLMALLDRADSEGGTLSLRGERFVLLGAGAELAPTRLLLAAGADVVWFDLRAPSDKLLGRDDLGGTLYVPEQPTNLLTGPMAIAATIRRFAESGPVHLGMYAYAGGESQEWRLTASMNGILRSLVPASVKSMSLLISPTTVAVASPEDVAISDARRRDAAAWKRVFERLGVLKPAGVPCGAVRIPNAIVPLQGASYQAAQYVGKVLSAETHAVYGPALGDAVAPMTVSANTAPITNTASLAHPLFQAGFIAAPEWGITISEPAMTTELNGLLAIADVTDPDAPGAASQPWPTPAARAAALFREQVHGGLFAQPWAAYGEIQVAAGIGLTRKPSLIADLVRSMRKG